jgi:hypothetical protein
MRVYRPTLETLEARLVLATIKWRPTDPGHISWSDPTNWDQNETPSIDSLFTAGYDHRLIITGTLIVTNVNDLSVIGPNNGSIEAAPNTAGILKFPANTNPAAAWFLRDTVFKDLLVTSEIFTIIDNSGMINLNHSTLRFYQGAWWAGSNISMEDHSSIINNSTFTVDTTFTIVDQELDSSFINNTVIAAIQSGTIGTNEFRAGPAASINVRGGATLTLSGAEISSSGTLNLQAPTATLACPNGYFQNHTGGVIRGNGRIDGSVWNQGIVDPGTPANPPATASIDITGDYLQVAFGELHIDIVSDADYDLLTVHGDVVIETGTVISTEIWGIYAPAPPKYFSIIVYGGDAEGLFTEEHFQPNSWGQGYTFRQDWTQGRVKLTVYQIQPPGPGGP